MSDSPFDLLELTAKSQGPEAAFALLSQKFHEEQNLPQLFETRLLKKRWELGLPLIQTEPLGELPDATRRAYEDAYIEAAREIGNLYLAQGNIPRAWPYFRAIGETTPVATAIDKVEPGEGIEQIIEIAFHERANPRKGFELILANHGTCSAITTFEQYPGREGRQDCVRMLVRKLHGDLVESLTYAINQRESTAPDSHSISDLIAGRAWLFEENNYHVDTSHLSSVIRFSIELEDCESQAQAVELTEYGKRLSPLFQYKGHSPFDDVYVDYGTYLRALLGIDVQGAIAHFRNKVKTAESDDAGTGPAQVLVGLLARIGLFAEGIEESLLHLAGVEASQLACPSVAQLCEMAGDNERLMKLARDQGDLLSFAAAVVRYRHA